MRIALDTETYWDVTRGVNIPFVATIYTETDKSKLFDLRTKSGYAACKKFVEAKHTWVFHNAPYDLTCLRNIGIYVPTDDVEDTMIQAQILNENFESKKLKRLAQIYLNEPCDEEKALSKEKSRLKREAKKSGKSFSFQDIPAEILKAYALKDPYYTYKLNVLFNKSIDKYKDIYELEKSIIPIIVDMQSLGMRLDRKFVKKMYSKYATEMVELNKQMQKAVLKLGLDFSKYKKYKREPKKKEAWDKIKYNTNDDCWYAMKYEPYKPKSAKQFRKVIEKLGIEIKASTKGGEVATDAESLAPFKDVPLIKMHLRHSFLQKQVGTYYGPMYEWYTSTKNDRAHFSLYQSGAKSGRFSAELIQTIPRKDEDKTEENVRLIRNAFVPAKGYNFLCIDYDQIEMRLFAHFAKCKPLIDGINSGMDPHDSTTFTLFGKEAKQLKEQSKTNAEAKAKFKGLRRIAKTINFGIIYGMGTNKLAASLGLSTYEARSILKKYYDNYPVKEYMSKVTRQLYKTGSVTVLLDSSLMRLYREYRVPQELAYKSANIIIQGTAAYAMKAGMKRVYDYIKENKLDVRLLMTIHDELIFEIAKKYNVNEMAHNLMAMMSDTTTFAVPIIASAKASEKSWGEAKDIK